MTFLIVCGGTAGHINPGLCIAEELKSRLPDSKILFIGADRDMEKRLIPAAGFDLINLKMSGIKRGIKPSDIIHNIKTIKNVLKAKSTVKKILKSTKPNVVIGTGGYVCYPVLKAAAKAKIPTLIHESNAAPGMTVKLLSGIVDKVMITYPGYEKYYKRPERLVLTGCPLRKEFFDFSETISNTDSSDKPLIVSFWGSLGSEIMNKNMAQFIKRNLEEKSFFHIHAAGNSLDILTKSLASLDITETQAPYADIRKYIDNMPLIMKSADLVLCRAGAITLAELITLGKPCILIPSPYVPDNVQTINAGQLEKAGAARMITEDKCSGELLYDEALKLINNKTALSSMSEASLKMSAKNATSDIVDLILEAGSKKQ